MKFINKTGLAALAIAGLATASAQANTISGKLWHVTEAESQNATIATANAQSATADVTFDVNDPINFDSRNAANGYTIGGFLATGGAFNIAYNTSVTSTDSLDPILMDFKGKVTVNNGDKFTVTHDDGLTLIINGIDLGFNPGPTAPNVTTVTYNGPSGTFDFELVYGECCGAPAVLQTSLPLTNAPDSGSTLALLGGAFTLMGAVSRRARK